MSQEQKACVCAAAVLLCSQVFALTKERDALKRAAAAASAGGDTAAEAAALRGQLHRKDELVSQVGSHAYLGYIDGYSQTPCAGVLTAVGSCFHPYATPSRHFYKKRTRSSASGKCRYVISRAATHRLSLSNTICHAHVPLAPTIATPCQHNGCHAATDLPSCAPAPLTQEGQKLTKQQLEPCHKNPVALLRTANSRARRTTH
jgi:hypothetical protein